VGSGPRLCRIGAGHYGGRASGSSAPLLESAKGAARTPEDQELFCPCSVLREFLQSRGSAQLSNLPDDGLGIAGY
jgi:hypothetical protein